MTTAPIAAPPRSQVETVIQSFSDAAEKDQDIYPQIYTAYFRRCPGSDELMAHTDHRMRGRMMEEVLMLLMADELSHHEGYLRFETKTHEGYGVKPMMYENLLLAVRDTVRELLGTDWGEVYESAWEGRIAFLGQNIFSALSDNEAKAMGGSSQPSTPPGDSWPT